ncbi:Aldo/keto reductase [Hyaloscypha bicolor E]|uniref:Aldo/keto reductase n=1 Tax=Hyaloscypha bicolor E TaxID=1095630 RepID=A0A2J6TFF0_9HELO|nr:Aldo/keto reductase [Hyaloscypha bicolor E]PMD61755.1 Aldo/keto reductase [Hyaloscypha bicolor E]
MASPELLESLKRSLENSKAEYVRLGKSGLKISVPFMGAMSLGPKHWAPWLIEEEEALPLLKAAYDQGINTWDPANVYSSGESERMIAKAIKKYDLPRHKLVIMTKCSVYVPEKTTWRHMFYGKEMPVSKDHVNQGGQIPSFLSRQAILNTINASLDRLETTYIDLLQIHQFDDETPVEETVEALHNLVKAGKVRYTGASSMWATQLPQLQFCAEKHGWAKFISMQNYYNTLYREEEREMNRFCNETGVGIVLWAPLQRGYVCRPPEMNGTTTRKSWRKADEFVEPAISIVRRVQEVAEIKGWKMSQVALAWINTTVSSSSLVLRKLLE